MIKYWNNIMLFEIPHYLSKNLRNIERSIKKIKIKNVLTFNMPVYNYVHL